jgi:hypothetical protein
MRRVDLTSCPIKNTILSRPLTFVAYTSGNARHDSGPPSQVGVGASSSRPVIFESWGEADHQENRVTRHCVLCFHDSGALRHMHHVGPQHPRDVEAQNVLWVWIEQQELIVMS